MAKTPRVVVTKENETGRNIKFQDTKTGQEMSRTKFVKEIEADKYTDYTVKKIHGLKTPVSLPDDKKDNNLG
jgi:hypothetical protein